MTKQERIERLNGLLRALMNDEQTFEHADNLAGDDAGELLAEFQEAVEFWIEGIERNECDEEDA